ncbi:protein XAP5 CIRCADIAN TIMEKEEPER-like [Miscanthus floridulus]|uniref:protein XAP5 CIRCADIAN TIMEKEEPER-like n=1 Tax=Miscanthus floridulus TaxID=154761 RepID=UPI0034588ABE
MGTAQDAVKIRRLEKQRKAERCKIEELKNKSTDGQPGLLQFGSSTSEACTVMPLAITIWSMSAIFYMQPRSSKVSQ